MEFIAVLILYFIFLHFINWKWIGNLIAWSHCYLKLMCNSAVKQVHQALHCNKKLKLFQECWNWSQTLAMNSGCLLPFSDRLTQLSVKRPCETSLTKWCYPDKLWFLPPLQLSQKWKAVLLFVQLVLRWIFRTMFHKTDDVTWCYSQWKLVLLLHCTSFKV